MWTDNYLLCYMVPEGFTCIIARLSKLKFDSNQLLSLLEMMIVEIEYKDQRKLKGTC